MYHKMKQKKMNILCGGLTFYECASKFSEAGVCALKWVRAFRAEQSLSCVLQHLGSWSQQSG